MLDEIACTVKRLFLIENVPAGHDRGGHAHRSLHQTLVCLRGSFTARSECQAEGATIRRMVAGDIQDVEPMTWLDLTDWTPNAQCLVLCSEHYDVADYVRSKTEWIALWA